VGVAVTAFATDGPAPAGGGVAGVDRVGVVGCGAMGAGVVEVCARAGFDVVVAVSSDRSAEAAWRRLTDSLDTAVGRGRLEAGDAADALRRIALTTDLANLRACPLVVESVVEDEAVKATVLRGLDEVLDDPEAIVASNTSSIPIASLARHTARPGHLLGMHFFNPVPAMPLVELSASGHTEEAAYKRATAFAGEGLGKEVIRAPDRPGFVVNALLMPYLMAAIRMVESGYAPPEDVDRGMTLGCGYPMGPLRLADFVGLDTLADVAGKLHAGLGDPAYAVPALLTTMVAEGRLGKKSGHGFYSYR
jgi:3-hydroxybutyryl-CoA dehydrogenase